MSLGGMTSVMIRSVLSKIVQPNEVGRFGNYILSQTFENTSLIRRKRSIFDSIYNIYRDLYIDLSFNQNTVCLTHS